MSLDMNHPYLKIIETPIKIENFNTNSGKSPQTKRKNFAQKVAGSIDMFANLNKEAQHHLAKRSNIAESDSLK